MQFRHFLINEESEYFGSKVGNILSAVHDLADDSQHMVTRHLNRLVSHIVNQIRSVIHSQWSISQRPYLEELQKIGVALAKAADEKEDLAELLPSVGQELETIMGKIGTPVNQVGSDIEGS